MKPLRPHYDTMSNHREDTLSDRIRFLRAGLGTRRYHQRYTAEIDTVGKHSAGVVGFILLMHKDRMPSANLLAAAICHDLPEAATGDIPAPAKRAWTSQSRIALSELEDRLLRKHGFHYELTEEEHRILKIADVFDGLMFCIEELNRGNREVQTVGETYVSYINELSYIGDREHAIVAALTAMWKELNQ